MNEEFPWRNMDDHRSVASAACTYANSDRHKGAGYTLRLTLAGRTFKGTLLHEAPGWLIMSIGDNVTFVAKSAIQAMEIIW